MPRSSTACCSRGRRCAPSATAAWTSSSARSSAPARTAAGRPWASTAGPAALGAALAALRIIRWPEGRGLLAAALANAESFAEGLSSLGYRVLGGEPVRTGTGEDAPRERIRTPIIPILVGDDWKAA